MQGSAVISALLKRKDNFEIVAMVRDLNSEASRALSRQGIQLVYGDLMRKDTLKQAFAGADGVFLVTIPVPFNAAGCKAEVEQGTNAVGALVEAKTPFVVFSSVGRYSNPRITVHCRNIVYSSFVCPCLPSCLCS